MVKRSQYGTAKVRERETGRPLLVLLLIAAAGLMVFLWMQDDGVDPVVTAAEDTTSGVDAEDTSVAAAQAPSNDSGLADWWYDVESPLYDAFSSVTYAEEGDCEDLEFAIADLRDLNDRPEPPIKSALTNLISSLDRALGACRSNNAATVSGSATSARSHLNALKSAASGYGLPPAQTLEGL